MKKTYMQPTATVIRFDAESAVAMLAGSKSTGGQSIEQSDDWSNERQWDDNFDWIDNEKNEY